MKTIRPTRQFLRDLKLAGKCGKNLVKIEVVIDALARGAKLAPRHRPHRLKGEMQGLWECHVEPDWLLVWDEQGNGLVLVRTGTHADLFE
ncbi:MAG: type II toxin-antitoxin system RelE/ParE family toxin [Pseudomonadota bacterium]